MELKVVYLPHYRGQEIFRNALDACFDLRAAISDPVELLPGDIKVLPLGIKTEFSAKYVCRVFPRSGLGSRGITLVNNVGIIDSGYRGEWKAPMINLSRSVFKIFPGDRILQAAIDRVVSIDFVKVDESELSSTDRGEGGFGSTGLK